MASLGRPRLVSLLILLPLILRFISTLKVSDDLCFVDASRFPLRQLKCGMKSSLTGSHILIICIKYDRIHPSRLLFYIMSER